MTSSSTTVSGKYSMTLLLGLVIAGLAGNYFSFPIFLNKDFLFGSIFAMLALQFFGLGRGIMAAAIIAGYTYIASNHPYGIIIMTAEVAVVGWLMFRRKTGMVLADTLYWLIIGMPLTYLFYHVVMHVSPSNVYISMSKFAINGIANTVAARLLFAVYAPRSHSLETTYRETIYNLLAFFVLFPGLIMLVVGSRTDFTEADQHIRTTLIQDSSHLAQSLETWVVNRRNAIVHLAEMAASRSPEQMQPFLEQKQRSDDNFIRVGLLNAEAITTAYAPLVDELGKSNIGRNNADRPYIPILRQTLKPMLSEVVMGRVGIIKPRVFMLAPVVIRGEYGGYVIGVLELQEIQDHLEQTVKHTSSLYSLIDKNGNVIMTNRNDQTVMKPFVRGKGVFTGLDSTISQWLPDVMENTPVSDRWRNSFYISESAIGSSAEWKLILEQPVEPFQKKLYNNYAGKLSLLFLILLLSLLLAEYISRKVVATLEQIRNLTDELPARLEEQQTIIWPESRIKDTQHLINNFRVMAELLTRQFSEGKKTNELLERMAEERASQLDALTHELGIILDNAPIGISKMVGRKQKWVNRHVENMLLYSKSELESQDTTRKLYPSDEAYNRIGLDAYPVLAQGLPFETEQVLLTKNGDEILVRYIGQAVDPSDMDSGIIWIVEDITERRQSEVKLEEAAVQWRTTFDTMPDPVTIIAPDYSIVKANRAFAECVGRSGDELVGLKCFSLVHGLDCPASGCPLDLTLKEHVENFAELYEPLMDKHFQVSTTPMFDDGGLFLGAIHVIHDITELKRTEEAIQQALDSSNSVNKTMSRLLRTIAHEFRTPLGLLTGSTDIIDTYWERLTPEKRLEQTERIRSAAYKLTNLVSSVVSFNKLESDKSQSPHKVMDIAECCYDIATDVEIVWSSGQNYTVTIAADCGSALLDWNLFRRILENLLTNAFRYTPTDGSVSLRVTREQKSVCIEVQDTGIGVPEEDRKLIFEAFYRSCNVGERSGLGLGLSIVHEALEQMGGSISVSSNVGEGTVMQLKLPVAWQSAEVVHHAKEGATCTQS